MSKNRTSKTDYFISYATADSEWATWIGWVIEEESRSVTLMEWDFTPGRNFVLEMDRASRESEHTIAVLSPNYLASQYTHAEWAAAFAQDPKGKERGLIPIRVEDCVLDGLLAQVVCIDLIGKTEEEARVVISQMVLRSRMKPVVEPAYPGLVHSRATEPPEFPSEEEGLLDLVERGVGDLKRGNESTLAFAHGVEELGTSAHEHAARFRAVPTGPGKLQAYRQVSWSVSRDMNRFSRAAEPQLREMARAYESGLGAWDSALKLLPEFGEIDESLVQGNLQSLEGLLESIPRARNAIAELRDSVARFPRVDGVFAAARRRAAEVLDQGVRALDRVEFLAQRASHQGQVLLEN
ncbi:toll/interleukin-1 receptor domain-containing protein [Candidatus Bipolaricaulota bacterium]|nr:toll/interleukin-1 receptor domain-containing protein [Candidatus Bipolaricaulota bacterium]